MYLPGWWLCIYILHSLYSGWWWLEPWNLWLSIGNVILPIDELIFFGWVGQPPTRHSSQYAECPTNHDLGASQEEFLPSSRSAEIFQHETISFYGFLWQCPSEEPFQPNDTPWKLRSHVKFTENSKGFFLGANPGFFRKCGKQENQPWYRHKHVYHIIRQFVYFGCFDLWNFGVTYSRTKPSRIVDYIIRSIPWHVYTVIYITIDYFTFRIIWKQVFFFE